MSEAMKQQILAHEEQLAHAKRTLDLEALNLIYADDLMLTGVQGEPTCSKPAILDEVRRGIAERDSGIAAGKTLEVSGANEDMKVAVYGHTAVTNYRFFVRFKGENMDIQRNYRTTNVWTKRQDRWQIVAAHTALVLDPKQLATLGG